MKAKATITAHLQRGPLDGGSCKIARKDIETKDDTEIIKFCRDWNRAANGLNFFWHYYSRPKGSTGPFIHDSTDKMPTHVAVTEGQSTCSTPKTP